jgi:transposase-like protein
MGRSYWFECPRCGYRAKVSGKTDQGLNFFVQTIVCHDCRELYDAVTRLKVPDDTRGRLPGKPAGLRRLAAMSRPIALNKPPTFYSAMNRLRYTGVKHFKWLNFKTQCPASPHHRVRNWNEPDKCPRCGTHLEKSALPYRIWD